VGKQKLRLLNKRLRQALEVYSDESSWFSTYDNKNEVLFMHDCGDGYKIAQEALKGE
jgi:chromosome condensin MukBEF complex kleisin-like MukF subunit